MFAPAAERERREKRGKQERGKSSSCRLQSTEPENSEQHHSTRKKVMLERISYSTSSNNIVTSFKGKTI